MISKGPLTNTSAFPFENYYSELQNSFQPGTKSPLKQMLQATILKRKLSPHCCQDSIYISNHDTELECNTLIYTFDIEQNYQMYKIIKITASSVLCKPQGRFDLTFKETPELKWGKVGVFKKGGIGATEKYISINEIKGKVISVTNYLITCPINVLREK